VIDAFRQPLLVAPVRHQLNRKPFVIYLLHITVVAVRSCWSSAFHPVVP